VAARAFCGENAYIALAVWKHKCEHEIFHLIFPKIHEKAGGLRSTQGNRKLIKIHHTFHKWARAGDVWVSCRLFYTVACCQHSGINFFLLLRFTRIKRINMHTTKGPVSLPFTYLPKNLSRLQRLVKSSMEASKCRAVAEIGPKMRLIFFGTAQVYNLH